MDHHYQNGESKGWHLRCTPYETAHNSDFVKRSNHLLELDREK